MFICFLQRSGEQRWKPKPKTESQVSATGDAETVTNKLSGIHIGENSGQTKVQHATKVINSQGSTVIWKPKSYGTVSGGATVTNVESTPVGKGKVGGSGNGVDVASTQKSGGSAVLSKLFSGNLLENFTVDSSTYGHAQIRATFYPKFENEKSDQEVYHSCLSFSVWLS